MLEHAVLAWTLVISCTIKLSHKLQNNSLKLVLMTIYKDFIRPHLDFGDILYDQAYNTYFHPKLEIAQYNACLLAAVIYLTWKEELCQELGLEWITKN